MTSSERPFLTNLNSYTPIILSTTTQRDTPITLSTTTQRGAFKACATIFYPSDSSILASFFSVTPFLDNQCCVPSWP